MNTAVAHTEIRTMRPRGGQPFDRIYLICPNGHEVVSSPASTPFGQRLVAGEFGDECCSYGTCGWSAA